MTNDRKKLDRNAEIYFTFILFEEIFFAEVVELADAQASGACEITLVGVRVPPSALSFFLPVIP